MNDSNFDDVTKKIAGLPRAITPARDLWPEIRSHLEPVETVRRRPSLLPSWRVSIGFAAAMVLVATLVFWTDQVTPSSWNIAALSGVPRIDADELIGEGKWRKGQWLETDAVSRARLAVGDIGEVQLEPNSRLRLLRTATTDHRVELARGTLHALIWAPPRIFFVETPSATAADLGCAYTLTVDDSGASTLQVTAGYVALEHGERVAFIPAGMSCVTRPGVGPGTPYSDTSDPAFRDALRRFDFAQGGDRVLAEILSVASAGDEVSLWHLLSRTTAEQRIAVFDKLALLHAPPDGVTRAGILRGEKSMLTNWADSLGLAAAMDAP
jgi:hypothetical protein